MRSAVVQLRLNKPFRPSAELVALLPGADAEIAVIIATSMLLRSVESVAWRATGRLKVARSDHELGSFGDRLAAAVRDLVLPLPHGAARLREGHRILETLIDSF